MELCQFSWFKAQSSGGITDYSRDFFQRKAIRFGGFSRGEQTQTYRPGGRVQAVLTARFRVNGKLAVRGLGQFVLHRGPRLRFFMPEGNSYSALFDERNILAKGTTTTSAFTVGLANTLRISLSKMSMLVTVSFLLLLVVSPFLLLATWAMTMQANSFMRALAAHTVIGIAYLGLVLKFSPVVTGHDEYGLGQLALVLALIVAHIFIGFAHALYRRHQTKKWASQTVRKAKSGATQTVPASCSYQPMP